MPPPSRSLRRPRLIALVQIVLAAALLMWPLLIAGRPTLFTDTGAYWEQGRTMVVEGLHLDQDAPNPFDLITGAQVIDRRVAPDPRLFSTFASARSPIYSVLVFATQQLGTLWLTAALQALATAAVMFAIWRLAAPGAARWTYLAMMAALSAATSLAFYASFSMPDIFAGLDILIAIALTLYWDRMDGRTRVGLWSLLTLSLSFHTSHLLVAILLAPACAFALWRLGAAQRTIAVRAGALAAAIGVAVLANIGAAAVTQAITGMPARNPPFLTARLLADGPGRSYLRSACAHADPYFLCRFKDRPLDSSDAILWWNDADRGVFMISGFADRLTLEAEQPRFVRGVAMADPLGVAWAGLRDFSLQLTRFYVDDPLHDPCQMKRLWFWGQSTLRVLVVDPDRCGPADQLLLPPLFLYGLHGVVLILAGYALWRRARDRGGARSPRLGELGDGERILAATGLAVTAIVANAAICGVLSGPFARYEARLIWLVPMLALLALCAERAPARSPERIARLGQPATA